MAIHSDPRSPIVQLPGLATVVRFLFLFQLPLRLRALRAAFMALAGPRVS